MFETVGGKSDPKQWELTADHARELSEAYPAVDVWSEARKAWQWHRERSYNRKTAKGMPRFLNQWMSRQQDRAGPLAVAFNSPQRLLAGLVEFSEMGTK